MQCSSQLNCIISIADDRCSLHARLHRVMAADMASGMEIRVNAIAYQPTASMKFSSHAFFRKDHVPMLLKGVHLVLTVLTLQTQCLGNAKAAIR